MKHSLKSLLSYSDGPVSGRLEQRLSVLILTVLLAACGGSSGGGTPAGTATTPETDGLADQGATNLVDPSNGSDSAGTVLSDESNTVVADDVSSEPDVSTPNVSDEQPSSEITTVTSTEPDGELSEPSVLISTRVTFDVTVPAYVSDSLQVRLLWGDKDLTAAWVVDETWIISDDFPLDTVNPLTITFSDDNGATTLGSFETEFRTGTNASESVQVNADQFDTERWDTDGDGVSNLVELTAGTNPFENDSAAPVSQPSQLSGSFQAGLELVPDKTFSISWQALGGTEFYRVLENPDGVSGYNAISTDLASTVLAFNHRVALFNRINARYLVQACNSAGCVDSNELFITGTLEAGISYIKASNTDTNGIDIFDRTLGDHFGISVSLSKDGNMLAVGAPREDSSPVGDQSDNSAENAGAVYVFSRRDGGWEQEAYLKADSLPAISNQEGHLFGQAVSLSGDGSTLAVAASGGIEIEVNQDSFGTFYRTGGGVYIFERVDGSWAQSRDVIASRNLILSVALSTDGNTLAWSGPTQARIHVRGEGDWQEQATFAADRVNPVTQPVRYGSTVSINADGSTLVVGSFTDFTDGSSSRSPDSGGTAGAVYVYTRSGSAWDQEAYLKSTLDCPVTRMGTTLSLDASGDTLAAGGDRANAVLLYNREAGNWSEQACIQASNSSDFDGFGRSVSLSSDGKLLAIGAPDEESASIGLNGNEDNFGVKAGAAYLFANDNGSWQQQNYIKASNTDPASVQLDTFEEFGVSVSLSGDGQSLAIGASGEDSAATGVNGNQFDNSANGAGAVYLY